MLSNYRVRVVNSEIANLNTNHSFNFLRVARHTFAHSIDILRSAFHGVTGDIVALDREIDDLGIYNGEMITIQDSRFAGIGGAVLSVYRGGTDESTFGPTVSVRGNVLDDVGQSRRNRGRGVHSPAWRADRDDHGQRTEPQPIHSRGQDRWRAARRDRPQPAHQYPASGDGSRSELLTHPGTWDAKRWTRLQMDHCHRERPPACSAWTHAGPFPAKHQDI